MSEEFNPKYRSQDGRILQRREGGEGGYLFMTNTAVRKRLNEQAEKIAEYEAWFEKEKSKTKTRIEGLEHQIRELLAINEALENQLGRPE